MCCSVFNLQKSPLGSANMVAKKEERKKEKKRKGKDDRMLIRSDLTYLPLDLLWSRTDKRINGNHEGFGDTSYHPLHKFTMRASRIVVKFTRRSLGALHVALMKHAGRFIVFLSHHGPTQKKCRKRCITWWIPL